MIPERYAPQLYALFRVVAGFLFLFHGLQKLFGMFGGVGGQAVPLASMFGVAGVIELVGGVLIMIGLFTRIAAFIASGEMAAAFFIAHFPMGLVPIQNGGELAVLYCFAFLYIAARGPGMCSIDGTRRRSR